MNIGTYELPCKRRRAHYGQALCEEEAAHSQGILWLLQSTVLRIKRMLSQGPDKWLKVHSLCLRDRKSDAGTHGVQAESSRLTGSQSQVRRRTFRFLCPPGLTLKPDSGLCSTSGQFRKRLPSSSREPQCCPLRLRDSLEGLGYFQVKTEDNNYQHNCSNQQSASDADHNLRPQVEHLSHLAKKFRWHKWLHSLRATWPFPSPIFLLWKRKRLMELCRVAQADLR